MTAQKRRAWGALILAVACCGLFALLYGRISASYLGRSSAKIVLLLMLPLTLFRLGDKPLSRLRVDKRGLLASLGLGLGVYALIVGAYFAISQMGWYDFSVIVGRLSADAGVNRSNFLWISLYIAFVNSLVEEIFFRCWLFQSLAPLGTPARWSLCCGLFALYHVAIITGWFSPLLFLLAMAGLAAGAAIFHWLDERFHSLLPSWLVHMFANFAINTIGFLLMA